MPKPTPGKVKHAISPAKYGQSLPKDAISPVKDELSPTKHAVSPVKDGLSPPKDAVSPVKDEFSPTKHAVSPVKDGELAPHICPKMLNFLIEPGNYQLPVTERTALKPGALMPEE